MRRHSQRMLACLVLLLFLLPACQGKNGYPDLEPGADPVIDGQIKAGEWGEAMVFPFDDDSQLFLLVKGEYLFLAIRAAGEGMISGNVFLAEGEQISVLHTSAALGTAVYQGDGDQFDKTKDFDWCCRSRIDNQVSLAEREEFLQAEGWMGANSFLGAEKDLEYMIPLPEEGGMLAVNFIYVDGDLEKQTWPVGLADGVAQNMAGGFPDTLEFSVGNWISLEDIK